MEKASSGEQAYRTSCADAPMPADLPGATRAARNVKDPVLGTHHYTHAHKLRAPCSTQNTYPATSIPGPTIPCPHGAHAGAPIIHLAYRPKFRGFTFSSHASRRPVTHVVVALGDFSLDEVVQALGRGTGNVRHMLGGRPVQVLTYRGDLQAAKR